MTVRSEQLACRGLATNADDLLFTCPADSTCVLRTVTLVNKNAGAKNLSCWIVTAAATTGYLLGATSTPAEGRQELTGWHVLGPGDSLYARSSGATAFVVASGAILAGVNPL